MVMRTFTKYIIFGSVWFCLFVIAGCASHPYKAQLNQVESEALKFKACIPTGNEEKYLCAQKFYIGIQKIGHFPHKNIFLEYADELQKLYLMNYEKKISDSQLDFDIAKLKTKTGNEIRRVETELQGKSYTASEALNDFSSEYRKGLQNRPKTTFCNPNGIGGYVCQ